VNDRVEAVRQGYATAAQLGYVDTDWEWFFDRLATDDLEFRPAADYTDFKSVYRGREGWLEFWKAYGEAWQSFTMEVEEVFEPREGLVMALTRVVGAGHESGITSERKEAHAWWFRGERICRIAGFADREEAYRELGLNM
jgi:ketosteroid isomerase-like protein